MGRSAADVEPGAGRVASCDLAAWELAGLSDLTGRPDGPSLGPPPGLVAGARALAGAVRRGADRLGAAVDLDPLRVMAERAGWAGLRRRGVVSCGGSSRLVPVRDGWLAVTMARTSDWELAPAWLGLDGPVPPGAWPVLEGAVQGRTVSELMDAALGLGLPVAEVGERGPRSSGDGRGGVGIRRLGPGVPPETLHGLVVVDLTALWAGPLVGSILRRCGATVVKVESPGRPDGARTGTPGHYGALNGGKVPVSVDLRSAAGRRQLGRIVDTADVVLTSARVRALDQLGLDPEAVVRNGRPRVWLSVTGYGTRDGSADRVAFGDDAAAAGGLVVWDGTGPCFCADAAADPLTGLAAAAAVLEALATGGDHLVEASMADVAGTVTSLAPGSGAAPQAAVPVGRMPD